MDLPILGTIDLTPTGVFLFIAAVVAVAYFGRQLFGIGRAGRDAGQSDDAPQAESGSGVTDGDQDASEAGADDADGSHKP